MVITTPYARQLATAFAEAEARTYMAAYIEVVDQLQAANFMGLLVSVVNTLLKIMHKDRCNVHDASNKLMQEMTAKRSRLFVMAAAVDIAANDRKAGSKVRVLERLAGV